MRYVAAKVKGGRIELDEDVELPEGAGVVVAIPDGVDDEFELDAQEAAELDAALAASGVEPSYSVDEVMEQLRQMRARIGVGGGGAANDTNR